MCKWKKASFNFWISFRSRTLKEKSPFFVGGCYWFGCHNLVCHFCLVDEEFLSHLFADCMMVSKVWEKIYKWMDISFQPELEVSSTNFSNFISSLKGRSNKNLRILVWIAVCWSIWTSMNEMLFQRDFIRVDGMVDRAKAFTRDWFVARIKGAEVYYWVDWCANPLACLVNYWLPLGFLV